MSENTEEACNAVGGAAFSFLKLKHNSPQGT